MHKKRFLFLLLGSQEKASSRVRGYWVAEELIAKGHPCRIINTSGPKVLFIAFIELLRADIIVFQKCYSRWHLYLQKFAICLGKNTILDIDDKYSRIDSQKTLKNISQMIKNSYIISAGCQQLVRFAKQYNEKAILIPSAIRLKNYPVSKKNVQEEIVIGWIGNGNYYYQDLIEILLEPLTLLAENHNITFKIIGASGRKELYDSFEDIKNLKIQFIDTIDWASNKQMTSVLSNIDIGVYPLLDNDFNLYKCAFKALEYMAMEIPVIASPVGANCDVIEHGKDGFLASSNDEWVECLAVLISNVDIRKEMGDAGRCKIEKQYNTAIVASKLLETLQK